MFVRLPLPGNDDDEEQKRNRWIYLFFSGGLRNSASLYIYVCAVHKVYFIHHFFFIYLFIFFLLSFFFPMRLPV